MTAWHLAVDRDRCMGTGICAGTAPALFRLDGRHSAPVNDSIDPDESALDAADSCPAAAITVTARETVIGPRP
ncbi:ferredoxin [Streptomyces avicenniae]|uniref:ferredoxin n=1 Tax=Streptomyces avicenniae TaxID=500153 RepID=UPI00069C98B3|nr:ferredoxin [Streptomyces avicenniae]